MNPEITIRHRGGSKLHPPGTVMKFEQARLSIGRGEECGLRFDATHDSGVSSLHAEIRLEDGLLCIADTGSRNGVFVNGERIRGTASLRHGDLVRLGASGPQFQVEFGMPDSGDCLRTIQTEDLPMTIVGQPEVEPSDRQVRPFGKQPSAPLSAPLRAAASSLPPPSSPPARSPAHAAASAAVPANLAGKQSVGLNTLMKVVDQSVRRERLRTARKATIIGSLVAVVVGIAACFWPTARIRPIGEILDEVKQSVYLVAIQDNGFSKLGTAWSIGNGQLATNWHVAREHGRLPGTASMIVRSCSRPPVDLRIERVTVHPFCEAWQRLQDKYAPFIPGEGFLVALPIAYDVAILHVRAEDAHKLAPALPMADRDELFALSQATPVTLVGYPMENQAGMGGDLTAPEPQSRTGTISRLTNFYMGQADAKDRHLIGLDLLSAGGASGSPVIDARGKVIAINSAGNYMSLGKARVSVGGAYGQRVDLLQDLLEGRVDSSGEAAERALSPSMLQRCRVGIKNSQECATWLASQIAGDKGMEVGTPVESTVKVLAPGSSNAQFIPEVKIPSRVGIRVILPHNDPVPPVVATFHNGRYEPDQTMYYLLADSWEVPGGRMPKTQIALPDTSPDQGSVTYTCYLFPATIARKKPK
ncbi:MAG: FHA domain-containing protein [Planctomycetes bacterium]|nr:FHA domain-containing protein [Planctomycetota bacterium]